MDAEAVQAEYERLGYSLGWVFGMTPVANLKKARAVFVGLNPGGDDENCSWEVADGNAYFDEKWYPGSDALFPIQKQVQDLHALLGLGKGEVFAGQFIPFRSKSLGTLTSRGDAFAFGNKLWDWVIGQTEAKLFLCLGKEVSYRIARLLDAKPDGSVPSGWGSTTIGRYVGSDRVVVRLPHLSRYQLFTMSDEKRQVACQAILEAARPHAPFPAVREGATFVEPRPV